ncbi:GDYXXLXY domain-containing protein [Anaeromyxobacter oryzae]|uniref:Membrane-anchored protein n=1 Tax=Anaeromyxobacter oryzae TaxID=2918170 RepID=A0ABM7WV74_9BACT|nr:GDYXXLXY domain-containing protein [Anaeromyxobacter oryzae]BDG03382.1 hypothetical protein AMOR_23780 [Anaeromyxobacter oryzae]
MRATKGRLLAVVAIQVAILAAIPLRQVRARTGGTEITLDTLPVDPRDLLSGHYVILRFKAEEPPPDLVDGAVQLDAPAWLVLERAEPAWRAVAVVRDRPAARPDRVAIRTTFTRGHPDILYAERFYIPEARRAEVDAALAASRGVALVDLRVDGAGNVALVRFRVGGLVLED